MNSLTMTSPALAATPAATTALAAAWRRVRQRLVRTVLVVGAICVAIAAILTAIDGQSLGELLREEFRVPE